MTLPEAQRVTGHDGYDDISVAADGGTSPESSRRRSQRSSAPDFAVRTGKEQAEKSAQDLSDALGFIRIALLVFAGVALLVGGFLIFNTFAVTVAQRTKEFALLRTLGASRAQVLRSVLAETLAIGIGASILGIIGGLLLAPACGALSSAFGLEARHHEPRSSSRARSSPASPSGSSRRSCPASCRPAARRACSRSRRCATPSCHRPALRRRRIVVAALVEVVGLARCSLQPVRRPRRRPRAASCSASAPS